MPAVLVGLGVQGATWFTVAKVALFVASVAYSRAQANKMKKALKRGIGDISSTAQDRSFTAKDPVGPRQIIYGECRVGGNIVFIHTNGANNQYMHVVVAMAGHEVTSFNNLQFDDELVPLDIGGNATGRFAGLVYAQFFIGSPSQTSNAALLSNCPEVWTSDHRLRGIAGVYVRFKYSADHFPNGIPNITAVCRGKKVFDPRTSLTAWSRNPALIMADYMCDQKLGMGMDYASQINEPELIASANNCDEMVELESGSFEPRYTCSGSFTADTVHSDVLASIGSSMAGKYIEVSGRWSVISGYYRTPTLSFDENDLRGSISVQTKVTRSENFNAVKGTYISPENFWQPADFPPVTNSTYQTQDGNVRIFRDLQLNCTTSSATCQRLGKITLEKVRQSITVQWKGKLTCMRAQSGDVVNISNARMGWSNKPFEVVELEMVVDAEDIGVDMVLRETASGVYDWADGEETTIDLAPNTNLPSPFAIQPPTDIVATSDNTTTETEGSDSIARMLLEWTSPADEVVVSGGYIRIQYKPFDATTWRDWALLPGSQTEEYIYPVLNGLVYVARLRSENRGLGIVSPWVYSDPTAATGDTTPPAAPTGFTVSGGIGGISLDWTNPTDTDFSRTEIYEHTATTPAPSGGSVALASVTGPASDYFRSGLAAGVTRYYWIRSVDTSGNKSSWVGPSGATSAAEMSAVASPEYAFGYSTGDNATTGSIMVTVTGGIPTYGYLWEPLIGTSITIDSPTSPTTTFTLNSPGGDTTDSCNYRCRVTDSAGTIVYTQEVLVDIVLAVEE